MSKPTPRRVDVEIYDQKYSIVLRSPMDDREARRLADELDTRMRDIAAVSSTADSLKIAVLTALHILQELQDLRRDSDRDDALIRRKSDEWTHALEQLLR
ncbi:MAG TPA: cell division protein ZapA [Terriglobia bacterium]|nr:cell division protein ZapA [Terriglobia bacterium]